MKRNGIWDSGIPVAHLWSYKYEYYSNNVIGLMIGLLVRVLQNFDL